MTLQTLILRYTLFAVIATLINLATQRLVLMNGDGGQIFLLAVAAGTLTGLIVKYLLDKRWIFRDQGTGLRDHGQKFSLYTIMGIFTTMIFWGAETAFWWIWETDLMREIGAVLGLSVGYVIKYNLDRRYVFTDASMRVSA